MMSGECEECGEHALECVCGEESLTTCSEFPTWLAASLIKRNLEETQLMVAFQSLDDNGMKEEFRKFIDETHPKNIFDAMREFAKLHPDKFYVPDEIELYGKFISLKKDT